MQFVNVQSFYLLLFKNFPLYLGSFQIIGTLHKDCMGVVTLIQCPSPFYVRAQKKGEYSGNRGLGLKWGILLLEKEIVSSFSGIKVELTKPIPYSEMVAEYSGYCGIGIITPHFS